MIVKRFLSISIDFERPYNDCYRFLKKNTTVQRFLSIFIDFERQYNDFHRFWARGSDRPYFCKTHRAEKSLKIMPQEPPEPQVRYGRIEFLKVMFSLDVFLTF